MRSFELVCPCSVGVSPISLVVVTAADRAAATLRRGGRTPPPAVGGHLPFQGRLGRKRAKRLPPQRELSAARPTEDMLLCWGARSHGRRVISSTIRCRGWSPSFCGRRQGVTAESPQATVSCPSDTTKGLCDRPLETFARSPLQLCGALRWQVAAALSAAVTTTKQQETTLQLAAAYCMEEKTTRTAATLRMRGSGVEALL